MRTFAVTYHVPGTCDCCGAALPVPPGSASPGGYTLELPEGASPTEVRVADGLSVTLGGGKLVVRLRMKRGSNKQWSVLPLYNSEAFTKLRSTTEHPDGDPDYYWYVFTCQVPEYKPNFTTWWAELKFTETPWGARASGAHLSQSHNAASVSVRLKTLE